MGELAGAVRQRDDGANLEAADRNGDVVTGRRQAGHGIEGEGKGRHPGIQRQAARLSSAGATGRLRL